MSSAARGDQVSGTALFRRAMGRFATGVTVLTVRSGKTVHGMTVNAFCSVSLDPPLVLACVASTSVMARLIPEADGFAVSILSAGQRRVAEHFAHVRGPAGTASFAAVPHVSGPATGAPVLAGAAAWLEFTAADIHTGGDHLIIVGRVRGLALGDPSEPLLVSQGAFR
ncbi:flavin reductase family protein [Nonomuraea sp. NPDC049141]|uniref:flavin reductase family protein n=1 Tax=Nonomuraea sp. NPDC049141 TaxID=3155500 RepID=UPI0033C174EE